MVRSLSSNPTIGVAILTWKSRKHLPYCLPPLMQSPLKPRILVIDSSSNDGTLEYTKENEIETVVIPQSEFNHGLTREYARKKLATDIVIMVTPDAYAIDEGVVGKLVRPIINQEASVAYARQLPHKGAKILESFPREFNYPPQSHIRSKDDLTRYGVYTYFCSNSCAAYLNRALDEIGGFPETLTGEDTLAVAKLLAKNHRIAYVAEACVYHSHDYTLRQEFQRYFDTGYARKLNEHWLASPGGDEARGKVYTQQLLQQLIELQPLLLPYAILQIGSKWLGYKLGKMSLRAPLWWKKKLSSHKAYWNGSWGSG